MSDLLLRLRALFLKKRIEQDLDEELGFHIEMQMRKNLAAGMSVEEARRQARIQFGAGDAVKEECRDARRVGFIETLFQDICYAVRGFRRTPMLALTVVGTIALGLGWNTAAFTIFNAYVLRPLAVRDPYSLYAIGWVDRTGDVHRLTWAEYEEFRREHPGLAEVAAALGRVTRMDGRIARCWLVDGEYFRMLGVNAAKGRTLLPEDSRSPGSEAVVVLSYSAWQNRFGAAADILGRKVTIHGHPFEVVGVMPEGFTGLGKLIPDFWAPITMIPTIDDGPNMFTPSSPANIAIFGRLKAGEGPKQAQAVFTAWIQRIATNAHAIVQSQATVIPFQPKMLAALLPMEMVFLLVLLSACANVANMMLARAMSRQREIGIRLSLGAARSRVIRQLLTESILLAVSAAVAAFVVSKALIGLGVRMLFAGIPQEFADYVPFIRLSPDVRVFGYTLGAAIAAAVLFGLAPAIQCTRMSVMQAARGDFSSEFRPSRLRNSLVVGQVAVCALLLICSGVFLRAANRIQRLDTGMRTRGVIEIEIREKSRARAIGSLAAEPGVDLLAATSDPPIDSTLPAVSASGTPGSETIRAPYKYASPEYFQALEIPIVRGRNFTGDEARSVASVAILSAAAAQRLWPNQHAIGQSLFLTPDPGPVRGDRPPKYRSVRVVGVARDTAVGAIYFTDKTCLYFPTSLEAAGNTLLARVQGDPDAARKRLESAVEAADPGAIDDIHKIQDYVLVEILPSRAAYWVSAALGGIALLLTLSEIYGVLSYVVSQRTKEIGIRVVMGAGARAVTGLVLKQCVLFSGLGIAVGSMLALAASKLVWAFSSQVEIDPFDRLAYAGGMALVLAACICAAYVPARRATRVDPIATLRYD